MLDRVDEALETAIHDDRSLLLIKPADQQEPTTAASTAGKVGGGTAVAALSQVKEEASADGGSTLTAGDGRGGGGGDGNKGELVICCLGFLAVMMRNCINKHVFSSSEVCVTEVCEICMYIYMLVWGGFKQGPFFAVCMTSSGG